MEPKWKIVKGEPSMVGQRLDNDQLKEALNNGRLQGAELTIENRGGAT